MVANGRSIRPKAFSLLRHHESRRMVIRAMENEEDIFRKLAEQGVSPDIFKEELDRQLNRSNPEVKRAFEEMERQNNKRAKERWEDFEMNPDDDVAMTHMKTLRKFGSRSTFTPSNHVNSQSEGKELRVGDRMLCHVDGRWLDVEIINIATTKCAVRWIEESEKEGCDVVSTVLLQHLHRQEERGGGGGGGSTGNEEEPRDKHHQQQQQQQQQEEGPTAKWTELPEELLRFLSLKRGIRLPTNIQDLSYGRIRAGENVICVDQSGSGKTLAYMLPLIARLREDRVRNKGAIGGPRMLIIAPTVELAQQIVRVCQELYDAGSGLAVREATNVEGIRKKELADEVSSPDADVDIFVATPRCVPALQDMGLLRDIRCVVLDEADQFFIDFATMVDFDLEMEFLAKLEREAVQQIHVTATIPNEVRRRIELYAPNATLIQGPDLHRPPSNLDVRIADTSGANGYPVDVYRVLRKNPCKWTICFIDDLVVANDTYTQLQNALKGWRVLSFYTDDSHPFLSQRNLALFAQESRVPTVLIATGYCSLGIDFKGVPVDHVILCGLPDDNLSLLRKIGRTARRGRKGRVTLLTTRQERTKANRLMSKLTSGSTITPLFVDGRALLEGIGEDDLQELLEFANGVYGNNNDDGKSAEDHHQQQQQKKKKKRTHSATEERDEEEKERIQEQAGRHLQGIQQTLLGGYEVVFNQSIVVAPKNSDLTNEFDFDGDDDDEV